MPSNAAEVDRLLKSGGAQLYNNDADEMTQTEHWASITRLALLRAFFDEVDADGDGRIRADEMGCRTGGARAHHGLCESFIGR